MAEGDYDFYWRCQGGDYGQADTQEIAGEEFAAR